MIWVSAAGTWGMDYKNPLHLDVVDRYLRRMGDKTIPVALNCMRCYGDAVTVIRDANSRISSIKTQTI